MGVWAHRQALAARDAGAEVRVLVLHRLVPPRSSLAGGPTRRRRRAGAARAREPRAQTRDGLSIAYVPYVSPERQRSYASWGAWAATPLALAMARMRRSFAFDLVHAHNAVPAGDAVRRVPALLAARAPLVISVHGGDVLYTAGPRARGRRDRPPRARTRAPGARQQPRHRRAVARARRARDARGAPRHRHPHRGAAGGARRGADARHRRAPGRAQAPRRRAARAGRADAAPPDAALRDRRRRPRARRALEAWRRAWA